VFEHAVFEHLVERRAVVDHDQISRAALVHAALGPGAAFNRHAVVRQSFQDAAAALVLGNVDARHFAHALDQRGLGAADHNALEAGGIHRQVVERVARHHDALQVKALRGGQLTQTAALVDAARQHVQITAGRPQQVAVQCFHSRAQFGADAAFADEERAAPLLWHRLALQRRKPGQLLQDRL